VLMTLVEEDSGKGNVIENITNGRPRNYFFY